MLKCAARRERAGRAGGRHAAPRACRAGRHGERSLAGTTEPLPADDLAGLGLGLARVVAGMHQRGVIHRDITGEHRGFR